MNKFDHRDQFGYALLRWLLAILIGIHGWHRILNGEVATLGLSLSANINLGLTLAVIITALQALGSILFALNRLVFPLSLAFAGLYSATIALHHAQHGWFTSGAKEDGMEYAVMLVILFLCVGWQSAPAKIRQ